MASKLRLLNSVNSLPKQVHFANRIPEISQAAVYLRREYSVEAINQAAPANQPKLPWPQYFRVRKNKRNWEMATTIPTSIAGFGAGLAYFGSLEGTGVIFGMDPVIVYGMATVGCMGLGWLVGPVIGGAFWRLSHRKALSSIEKRDVEFYRHIVKNRADPTRQSAMNPVPDFYGEKIGSLREYRRWLRDQGKFRRKVVLPEE